MKLDFYPKYSNIFSSFVLSYLVAAFPLHLELRKDITI